MSNKSKAAQVAQRIKAAKAEEARISGEIERLQKELVHQKKAGATAETELQELLANRRGSNGGTELFSLGEDEFCVATIDTDNSGEPYLSIWFGKPR